jgi:hypothetical protein
VVNSPSVFFDALRAALFVKFGLNFDSQIQSLQAVKAENYPWAMVRFESTAQMSVRVSNSVTDFDFPVAVEFAVLANSETYQNAVLDLAAEIAVWINSPAFRDSLPEPCGACFVNGSASSFQILGFENTRSCGGGLVNCNFKLRFPRECKF